VILDRGITADGGNTIYKSQEFLDYLLGSRVGHKVNFSFMYYFITKELTMTAITRTELVAEDYHQLFSMLKRNFGGYRFQGGPGSSVGIATDYGLDGPVIESRWGGEIFRTCPDRPWGPLSLLYKG
jgi:hypothetical protein